MKNIVFPIIDVVTPIISITVATHTRTLWQNANMHIMRPNKVHTNENVNAVNAAIFHPRNKC